ncbi:hypothetical protein BN946_scf185004.g30 [Trametes cinnabarina]|uniref:Uncharacterized protein n=1 Tax=Pycnoporus cinnabarinus TaxID=5643 RepID=A0A060SKI8_PYCCI|nr:hypothetical protein BN946_scf185004.g30 [Trametes cinnabarina]
MSAASNGLPSHGYLARCRNNSQDWVSQTRSMRLESPASEQSGVSTPITDEGGDIRIDEIMADEPMPSDENTMSVSPPRLSHLPGRGTSPPPFSRYLCPPDVAYTSPKASVHPQSQAQTHAQNPGRLQIPAIQIQAATPSPVQMFSRAPLDSPSASPSGSISASVPVSASPPAPGFSSDDTSMASPTSAASPASDVSSQQSRQQEQEQMSTGAAAAAKRQRFTMGPRADCELCRQRVKGHYMHFD